VPLPGAHELTDYDLYHLLQCFLIMKIAFFISLNYNFTARLGMSGLVIAAVTTFCTHCSVQITFYVSLGASMVR
jgi:hypothetical protein